MAGHDDRSLRSVSRCSTSMIPLSWLASFILPMDRPPPVAACLDESARDEPIVQSQTKPQCMEAQSDAASRPQSLSAPAVGPGQTRARSRQPRAPRSPGSPAPDRAPESGMCRWIEGGLGLRGTPVVWRGSHRLSRRLSCPQPTR
jgi:hypothetical protein